MNGKAKNTVENPKSRFTAGKQSRHTHRPALGGLPRDLRRFLQVALDDGGERVVLRDGPKAGRTVAEVAERRV